ncbi:AraC family transcriptional regulator [Gammaproteobacteria bacterium]|nr:AraC family transcriptional regulator [Gammaproteobacteria bacterium]
MLYFHKIARDKYAVLTLDKLCDHLEITVRPFAVCSVEQGERLMLGPRDEATVHYVVGGHGTLSFPEFSEFNLRPGTAIIAPTGSLHEVSGRGQPGQIPNVVRRCQPAAMGLGVVGKNPHEVEGGMVLLCGTVDVTYRHLNDFFDYLPAPIIIQASPDDPISRAFEEIVREMTAPRPGTGAMLSALFQQCFIELLRRQGVGGQCAIEWLSALEDPRLSKVIDEIIDTPGGHYTLDLLAEKCLMSRTTFSERFHSAFGRPAMDFVREVRLRGAARLLRQTQDPIKKIAGQMGYASRSNFSHAFREFFGVAPAEYRSAESMPDG